MQITTMFLDIGGVVLTDGCDHRARRRAATHFQLAWLEMEARHGLTSETYEQGKLTLEEYLGLENAAVVRSRICRGLECMGVALDEERHASSEPEISARSSRVTVRVMHTDEERMIAQSVRMVLDRDEEWRKAI